MDIEVRRLRADEGARLRAVRAASRREAPHAFAVDPASECGTPLDVWQERARRRSAGDAEATFVAEAGDRLVGMAGGFLRPGSASAELVSMWTAPQVRRRGVGRRLVEAVADWAAGAGACDLRLWVVRGNEGAARLYSTCGFTTIVDPDVPPCDPCRDEQRMARSLAPVGPPSGHGHHPVDPPDAQDLAGAEARQPP